MLVCGRSVVRDIPCWSGSSGQTFQAFTLTIDQNRSRMIPTDSKEPTHSLSRISDPLPNVSFKGGWPGYREFQFNTHLLFRYVVTCAAIFLIALMARLVSWKTKGTQLLKV